MLRTCNRRRLMIYNITNFNSHSTLVFVNLRFWLSIGESAESLQFANQSAIRDVMRKQRTSYCGEARPSACQMGFFCRLSEGIAVFMFNNKFVIRWQKKNFINLVRRLVETPPYLIDKMKDSPSNSSLYRSWKHGTQKTSRKHLTKNMAVISEFLYTFFICKRLYDIISINSAFYGKNL